MPTLIYKAQGNKYINHSFFRPYLKIYDQYAVYTKRKKVLFLDEYTMPYEQIARINLHMGILFSRLEVVLSGGDHMVVIKGVRNPMAKKAKRILDQKVHHAHKKTPLESVVEGITKSSKAIGSVVEVTKSGLVTKRGDQHIIDEYEQKLNRLKELRAKGKLSKTEFEKKRKKLLNTM